MPVRDILLDDNGERLLVNGDYGRADGEQAIKQGIECNVKLYKGDCWLDEDAGVDYLGRVLVAHPSPVVVKAEIARAIAATPDVTNVVAVAYTTDPQTRAASVAYDARSTLGNVEGTVTP